jgi:hypothetical protein
MFEVPVNGTISILCYISIIDSGMPWGEDEFVFLDVLMSRHCYSHHAEAQDYSTLEVVGKKFVSGLM